MKKQVINGFKLCESTPNNTQPGIAKFISSWQLKREGIPKEFYSITIPFAIRVCIFNRRILDILKFLIFSSINE